MSKVYTVGEIKRLVLESSTEFKPMIGDGVESENKKNNGKVAYNTAKDRVKPYGGLEKKEEDWARGTAKYEKIDGNHTTLGHNPENASDKYKARTKANVLGYSSEQEMKNGIDKNGDYTDNKNIYDELTKSESEMDKNMEKFKKTGLQASKMSDETFEKDTLYESEEGFNMRKMMNKLQTSVNNINESEIRPDTIKTIYFKKTTFLTEGHMYSRIPDDFKTNGNKFKMKDKTGNEYLIEWKYNKPTIIEHHNKKGLDESLNKMKHLMDYSTQDTQTNNSIRMNGDKYVQRCLDITRKQK